MNYIFCQLPLDFQWVWVIKSIGVDIVIKLLRWASGCLNCFLESLFNSLSYIEASPVFVSFFSDFILKRLEVLDLLLSNGYLIDQGKLFHDRLWSRFAWFQSFSDNLKLIAQVILFDYQVRTFFKQRFDFCLSVRLHYATCVQLLRWHVYKTIPAFLY